MAESVPMTSPIPGQTNGPEIHQGKYHPYSDIITGQVNGGTVIDSGDTKKATLKKEGTTSIPLPIFDVASNQSNSDEEYSSDDSSDVMPVPFLPSFQSPFISGMKDCRCKCSLAARWEKVDGAPTKSGEAAIISRSLVALLVGAAGPMIEGTASTSIICTWALRTIEPKLVASKSR